MSAPISRRGRRRNKSFARAGNPLSLGIQQVKYSIEGAAPRTFPPNGIFQIPAHAIAAVLICTPRFFATFRTFKTRLVSIVVCHSSLSPRTREFAPGHFQGKCGNSCRKRARTKHSEKTRLLGFNCYREREYKAISLAFDPTRAARAATGRRRDAPGFCAGWGCPAPSACYRVGPFPRAAPFYGDYDH